MKLISVVLSGGAGTRLWPVSRQGYPKPFMKLGGTALLEQAIARAEAHSSPGYQASVLVVAFPGGAGTASLMREARRMASRSPVPISVAEVSPSAGLWAVPAGVGRS